MMSVAMHGQEVCQNGLDDDGDGMVDMADSDCFCYNPDSNPPSLISNYSFEEMEECPSQTGQIELAKDWKQATAGTPDYFNCNYSWAAADSVGIKASHGTGYVGALYTAGWKEYLGQCLPNMLTAGTQYQMLLDVALFTIDSDGNYCGNKQASDFLPVEIVIYGNKHCSSLPQTGNLGCPTGEDTQTSTPGGDPAWVILGSVLYDPSSDWKEMVINFTPSINVSAIMIGPPCTLPEGYDDTFCSAYMVYDNLTLNTYSSFFGKVEAPVISATKKVDCDGSHYTLTTEKIEGATYYWLDAQNTKYQSEELLIDAVGATGIYSAYYVLGNCTSEVTTINPSEAATTLPESQIELPNIITPNGDGSNDVLNAETILPSCYTYELTLVDRWGGLVHKQSNGQPAFTGKNQLGADVNDGVYFYTIQYQGNLIKGSLTVVR